MPSPFFSTTSRWALRYLLGTSNVSDIDAGFQALATDIDNLPLSLLPFSSSAATLTAVDGQALNCSGAAQTVTLPTTAKGLVGVRAGGTQTGANPVTLQVSGGSGQVIVGLGVETGVTSIPLGTPGASVILLLNGSVWRIVAGRQDTGWVALTLGTSISSVGGNTAAVRVQGDAGELSGALQTTASSISHLASVPANCAPAHAATYDGTPTRGRFSISGTSIDYASTQGSGVIAYLDGLRYRLN